MIATKQLTVEQHYIQSTPITHRKQYGQFFTPAPVADMMARWVAETSPKRVLEPAIGTGILAQAMLNYCPDTNLTGIDIDPSILAFASQQVNYPAVNLVESDFIQHDWQANYDGIIANPPYFKFHDYDNKLAIQEVQRHVDVKLSGFTNLYALFLIKAVSQLAVGARAAFLVPSEFLNADYGVAVKEFLVKQGCLRHVLIVHFEQMLFDDALTTACILLLEKKQTREPVTFSTTQSASALENWSSDNPDLFRQPNYSLDPLVKWRAYYQAQNALEFRYLVPFNTVGKVVRGIATGANDYFMFSPTKAQQWSMPPQNLLPCIAKAADVPTSFFTDDSLRRLRISDKSIYIFNGLFPQSEAVSRYLAKGEKDKINRKFLTANRKPWYSLENRPPAPIWVTVFNRNGLRCIRNETQTLNLTTFHCVYLTLFYQHKTDLVMAYLLTDVAKDIFNDNRREYGNGLQKFEPNDLNKAMMVDLGKLPATLEANILVLYEQYRQSELEGKANESLRLQLDHLFREFYTA
jgi:adenine-specific DNA-methyltransferase